MAFCALLCKATKFSGSIHFGQREVDGTWRSVGTFARSWLHVSSRNQKSFLAESMSSAAGLSIGAGFITKWPQLQVMRVIPILSGDLSASVELVQRGVICMQGISN